LTVLSGFSGLLNWCEETIWVGDQPTLGRRLCDFFLLKRIRLTRQTAEALSGDRLPAYLRPNHPKKT
jgi:hypothetical protein